MNELSQGLVAGSNWAGAQVFHPDSNLSSSTWEQLLHGLCGARCQKQLVEREVVGHQMSHVAGLGTKQENQGHKQELGPGFELHPELYLLKRGSQGLQAGRSSE